MIRRLDHLQLAHPAGAEDLMRAFYLGLLGMVEVPKPIPLQGRGGFWAMAGACQIHFGVDPAFSPATKAHPAFVVDDLDALETRLSDADYTVSWDTKLPDVRRFFVNDPCGNRVELIGG